MEIAIHSRRSRGGIDAKTDEPPSIDNDRLTSHHRFAAANYGKIEECRVVSCRVVSVSVERKMAFRTLTVPRFSLLRLAIVGCFSSDYAYGGKIVNTHTHTHTHTHCTQYVGGNIRLTKHRYYIGHELIEFAWCRWPTVDEAEPLSVYRVYRRR